jgi:signal transduction histidine kinase
MGGGGVIALRVLELGDVQIAAPLLLVATVLAAAAVLGAEEPRVRDHLVQGAAQSVVTAMLSAIGLTAFYLALPRLAPGAGASVAWLVLVIFFAALPLEPLRMLLVERAARALFRRPATVPDLAASVESSEARADQAERLAELGRVVSAVAHEMRNPLGVIAAQTKLLERRGADPAALGALRAQVDRARHFLDDLLRYGKPRPLELRTFECGPAVELAVSNARQAFGATAPRVEVNVVDAGRIEADRSAFVDVVTVLVENACIALEAAEQDGAHVRVRAASGLHGGDLVLIVEDDGPGVPSAIEASIFEPFVTGRGRDARRPGTGLGLAIAARWVERHGGVLRHERPPSGGARFALHWRRRA